MTQTTTALKALYAAFGGDPDDVAGIDQNLELWKKIYVQAGGSADDVADMTITADVMAATATVLSQD